MRSTVYLAGPILGCTKTEANDWRFAIAAALAEGGLVGVSPLRCEPLIGERYGLNYEDPRFGTARAISSKNVFDVRKCDLTLAYLPTPEPGRHQSYGTICEVAWAHAFNKPAIVVTDDPNVADHPVINSCAGWVLDDLEAGVEVAIGILGAYSGGKNV